MSDSANGFDLDLAVSSITADGTDNQIMMRVLTERLAPVLGGRLRVEREGRLRKSNVIRSVTIHIQGAELVADLRGAGPSFTIGRLSAGIRIKNDQVDAASWIRTLLEALQAEADHNAATRQSLESLMIGKA